MIQTKTAFQYDNISDASAIIKLEIVSYKFDVLGKTFEVLHWAVDEKGNRTQVLRQERFRTHEQLKQVENYIYATQDLSLFTELEKEWEKIKIGLLLDVQTNLYDSGLTAWKRQPSDWEFTPVSV